MACGQVPLEILWVPHNTILVNMSVLYDRWCNVAVCPRKPYIRFGAFTPLYRNGTKKKEIQNRNQEEILIGLACTFKLIGNFVLDTCMSSSVLLKVSYLLSLEQKGSIPVSCYQCDDFNT